MILHVILTGFVCFAAPLSQASTIVIKERNICGLQEAACADGTCFPIERICDGYRDCPDGGDEVNCLASPLQDISPDPEFVVHRSRRQASSCGKLQWACKSGQCIDFDGKCDGVVNCSDGSDETHALCRGMKCQSFWFRCTYGACVDGEAPCNGQSECADDSDEIGPQCHVSSVFDNRFRCLDGGWIAGVDKCDGKPDCRDGSDESVRACGNITCSGYLFQCAYGACVDHGSECNGEQDCYDGSDENPDLCPHKGTVSNANSKLCKLPPYPKNGTYTVNDRPSAKPGQAFESATINVACHRGFGLANMQTEYLCVKGRWSRGQVVPAECVRQCTLNLNLESIEYTDCIFPETDRTAQCIPKVPSGTIVRGPTCRQPNYYSDNQLSEMTCSDGQWDFKPQCKPECGRVTSQGMGLVVNGTPAAHGELPWHVGIYDKTGKVNRHICGGSIVRNNYVITAAHCFWQLSEKRVLPGSNYAVAAGKIYKPWDDSHDTEAQKSEVEKIFTRSSFLGQDNNYANDIALMLLVTPFQYRPYIRPVCLRFDHLFETTQLTIGNLGKVTGWGLTSASGKVTGKLLTTRLPFIPQRECNEKAPTEFKPFIVTDKICAGYDDGTTTLCQGDSGGGLVFPSIDFGVERYYLRGIVSTSPQSESKCNVKAIVTFTKISFHEEWIRLYVKD